MPHPRHARRGLGQASRVRIADAVLRRRDGIGLAELAETTQLHENTVREHVRVLVDEGIIRTVTEHRRTRGRPRALYLPATGAGVDNPHAQRRIDDAKHHGDLIRRLVPTTDSALPADTLHQLDALYEHLDEFGLEPDLDDPGMRVDLTPCAFHDLIDTDLPAICRVHRALIDDLLERAGGPLEIDRMLPLITPHQCRLTLRRREPADPSGD